MVQGRAPKFGSISVNNPDFDLDVVIEFPTKSTTHQSDEGFNFIWPLADVYICQRGENPFNEDKQVDVFPKGITFTVEVPDILYDFLEKKEVKEYPLYLIYYNKDPKDPKWVKLSENSILVDQNRSLSVTLDNWIKDPPLGWGGDHPT